jgi:hypothetical protein
MAIDAYSFCPGGTGKKIKFCCGDFLPELQKIDRMVEGEQFVGCLTHIDHLLEQEPGRDRPCLLATKCVLLRVTERHEEADATVAAFLAKYPNNQIALAESAICTTDHDPRTAVSLIQRALRAADGALANRTYQAIGMTAGVLLHQGFPLPARALLQLQCELVEHDDRPSELLSGLSQAADIPLLLRDDPPFLPCPEGVAWKDRFDEAMQTMGLADWQGAADRFAALAADVPDEPVIWRNLATLRGWLADNAGCIDALRKYAALRAAQADGLDDAVEAEAEAMFLTEDPLGDRVEIFKLVWTVNDVERVQEAFLSAPRFRMIPFDPAQFGDAENPPPKAVYMLLDRLMPESAEGLSLENMPRLLGQVFLFGRQTDREARLELHGVAGDELSVVTGLIQEVAGDAVGQMAHLADNKAGSGELKKEVVGRWSASQNLLRAAWQPPRDATQEQLRELSQEYGRRAVLDRWPDLKLGILAGRSPRQVAGDESSRVRLLAAIMVLEHWSQRLPWHVDFNQLRAALGLPILGPIDPQQHSVDDLPTVRLERLSVEPLSDKDLVMAYYRATVFAIRPAVRKFAEAMVNRPSLADSDERIHAYAALARNEEDLTRALEYVEQGRRLAEAKKESSASWDLMELSLRFAARDGQQAMRLIRHVQERHLEEPGVGEVLTRMLMDVGLLRPDGTPAFGPGAPQAEMPAAEQPAAEAGKLWTPDSAEPGSGGGKLWTP